MEYSSNQNGNTRTGIRGKSVLALAGIILLAAAVGLLGSCSPIGLGPGMGSLEIRIAADNAKTLTPPIDMTTASYVVSGTGPNAGTFSTTVTGSSATVSGLAVGAWTVSVDGKNAAGTFITHGSATTQVSTGSTQSVSVSVAPIAGLGALGLAVSWPAAQVPTPQIQAQLLPASGSAVTLVFSAPQNGSSSSSTSGLQNGYYTLTLQLLDNGQLLMGAVEVVRIVKDQTTSGTFAFSNINTGKGGIKVNITPLLADPITVTISGQQAEIGTGVPLTVTGSVPAGTANVTYVWYINAAAKGTGSSFTFNSSTSPLAAGYYRLDVTAFTSDGLRAGSATCSLKVDAVAPVALTWNANAEGDLAGYKLYIGTTSGTYGAPTDVGLNVTATVPGMVCGCTYYFVVTAYNSSGMESAKSTELAYTIP